METLQFECEEDFSKDLCGGEEETSSRRRRRSRWDPPTSCSSATEGANGDSNSLGTKGRKRKSRWDDNPPKAVIQLPKFMDEFTGGIEFDPEILALNSRLIAINHKLKSSKILDDRPDGARSPSPEPIFDNLGIRINTREFRARDKLNWERQEIISKIAKKKPGYKPPGDCKPLKHYKKIYIPTKEYPGYNFIGLIIGPRGNTQKRMEKETGAKIVLRGKGSAKEGSLLQPTSKRDLSFDPSDYEDLHVIVEADTQESLEAAAAMVEKLLKPVDDTFNEHKRQQLRELAALKGTLRDDGLCHFCGQPGHKNYECPSRTSTMITDVLCNICGDPAHPTTNCPLKKNSGKKMDEEYRNFLTELGGTISESWWLGGTDTSTSTSSNNNTLQAGSGLTKPNMYHETNLYVGYLPPTVDEGGLIGLFSPFGEIVMSKVIKDHTSGLSKGYGFVKFANVQQANFAIATMNGYKIDGRTLAVRVAYKLPQPTIVPLPPAPPLPPCPVPDQPFGAFMYPPVPVQYPPSSFALMPESVSSTDDRYNFASFDETESYSHGQLQTSTSVPCTASPYIYRLSNGAILPPLPLRSTLDTSQIPSIVPWATNGLVSSTLTSAEKSEYNCDSEHAKFMASMKWADF